MGSVLQQVTAKRCANESGRMRQQRNGRGLRALSERLHAATNQSPQSVALEQILREEVASMTVPPGGVIVEIGGRRQELAERFPDSRYLSVDYQEAVRPDLVGDAHALPLGNGTVDLYVATWLLYFSQQPSQWIDEVLRVLKPGGCAIMSFEFGVYGVKLDGTQGTDWMRYTRATVASLASGFSRVKIIPVGSPHTIYANWLWKRLKGNRFWLRVPLGLLLHQWARIGASDSPFPVTFLMVGTK
jgi:SAM-dependent methyltransferase